MGRAMRLVICVDCNDFRFVRYRAGQEPPSRCPKCNCRKMNKDMYPQDIAYAVKDPLYHVWLRMRRRCKNQNDSNYHRYGGRGITVCSEWDNDVYVFIDWCRSHGYDEGLQLDRIDNNGPYSPSNCRFVTNQVNSQNTSRNVLSPDKVIQIRDMLSRGMSCDKISKIFNVSPMTIFGVKNGKTWTNIGKSDSKKFDYLRMVSGC